MHFSLPHFVVLKSFSTTSFKFTRCLVVTRLKKKVKKNKQDEAEVMPTSSLVEVEVGV